MENRLTFQKHLIISWYWNWDLLYLKVLGLINCLVRRISSLNHQEGVPWYNRPLSCSGRFSCRHSSYLQIVQVKDKNGRIRQHTQACQAVWSCVNYHKHLSYRSHRSAPNYKYRVIVNHPDPRHTSDNSELDHRDLLLLAYHFFIHLTTKRFSIITGQQIANLSQKNQGILSNSSNTIVRTTSTSLHPCRTACISSCQARSPATCSGRTECKGTSRLQMGRERPVAQSCTSNEKALLENSMKKKRLRLTAALLHFIFAGFLLAPRHDEDVLAIQSGNDLLPLLDDDDVLFVLGLRPFVHVLLNGV